MCEEKESQKSEDVRDSSTGEKRIQVEFKEQQFGDRHRSA